MSREKQIEEMAKVIAVARGYGCTEEDSCDMSCQVYKCGCIPYEDAEILYNAGYRKQEWISVDERMPDSDGKYLVYTGKDLIHTMYYYATNAFGFEHWDVTHWMPLPEAPKMKGGAEC